MDQYYDTDDGRGDDIDIDIDQVVPVPGQEAYDFTNAELARSLDDPCVPISYVIFKLIKAAPWFWKNSKTANCVLSEFEMRLSQSLIDLIDGSPLSLALIIGGGGTMQRYLYRLLEFQLSHYAIEPTYPRAWNQPLAKGGERGSTRQPRPRVRKEWSHSPTHLPPW